MLLAVLWSVVPVAVVTSMAYSEALFTALAAWAVLATLRRRWLLAGLLAALAGLTRPVGVAVVAAVAVPALVELVRTRDPRAAAGMLLAPLGFVGYLAWVGVPDRGAARLLPGGRRLGERLRRRSGVRGLGAGPPGRRPVVAGRCWCWPACVALVGLLVLAVRDRQPLPLLLLGAGLLGLALTTSGYFGSKPRYLLPAFPLLLPLALRLSRLRLRTAAGVLGVLALGSVVYGAAWLLGPGPP